MIPVLIMASLTLQPIAEAVLHLSEKTPVGSMLRTAEWSRVPIALRNQAQFSASVESARVLNRIQGGLESMIGHIREQGLVIADRSGLIRDITRIAEREGLTPADPKLRGTIQDITSERRAELIYTTQTGQAYGFANWKAGQDEDALDAAPAQELVRIRDAEVPRDWISRWREAGGRFFDGRMIALKTDTIWEKISRFGNPWPPYDFNSGMWVEDVSRAEAVELGLISPSQRVAPNEADFNAKLESSVKDLAPEFRQVLASHFGSQVEIDESTLKWKGGAEAHERRQQEKRSLARRIFSQSAEALSAAGSGDYGASEFAAVARSNAAEISAVASGRKPLFHEQLGDVATAALAARLQRHLPQGIIARTERGHLYVYHPDLAARFLDARRPVFEQIQNATESGDNGLLLGYGAKRMFGQGNVRVIIVDPRDNLVQGFWAERSTAELYAAARAQDFTDATGMKHTYELIKGGGA